MMGAALVAEAGDADARDHAQNGNPLTSVLLIGSSFKTSSIGFRERVLRSLHEDDPNAIRRISPHIRESCLLVTCNRTEVYVATDDPTNVAEALLTRMLRVGGRREEFYVKTGVDAVSHIFAVASGLDSLVLGEDQITQQIRDAGKKARGSGASGSILSALFVAAFNVGKRVRDSMPTDFAGGSVSAFALRFALEKLGRPPKTILLIGTGKTARLAASQLKGAKVYLVSRRRDALKIFPDATLVTYKQLKRLAWVGDLVISATRHSGYVLRRDDLPDKKKVVLLDLAFPRNIDPAFKNSKLIELYDLDDLAAHARQVPHESIYATGEKMVEEEAVRFTRRLVASRLSPTLSNIYKWAEEVRRSETEETLKRLPDLTDDERRVVETMSRTLVSRLMAPHTAFVKQDTVELSQAEKLHLLETLFPSEASK